MKSPLRATCAVVVAALTVGACGSSSQSSTPTASTAARSAATLSAPPAETAQAGPTTPTTPATTVAVSLTQAPITAVPTTMEVTTTTVASDLKVSVCSLVTAGEVSGVLGAAASDAGTERVFDTNYKSCGWSTPPGPGNATALQIGVVIRRSATGSGFVPASDVGPPQPVAGVGDNATFYDKPDPNFEAAELIANKGLVSVSIHVNYGSTSHAALQDVAPEIARQIFAQLNP